MAKVNTKFIIMLTGGILGTVAVAVLAMKLVLKSPKELAQTAADFANKGEYAAASAYIAKAVNKEQTNPEYLRKWREYLKKYAPPDATRGLDALTKLSTSLRQIAVVERENTEAQHEFLGLTLARIRSTDEFNNDSMRFLISQAEEILAFYDGKPEGKWQSLERYRGWALAQIVEASPDVKPEDVVLAKKSLEAASKADPDDVLVALAHESLYSVLSRRAVAAQKADEAAELALKAKSILDDYLARHPKSPEMQLRAVARSYESNIDRIRKMTDPVAQKAEGEKVFGEWKVLVEEITASAKAANPDTLDRQFRSMLRTVETLASPRSQGANIRAVLEHLRTVRPDDADVMIELAMAMAQRAEYDGAIELAQKVEALPNQPTSVSGLRLFDYRVSCVFFEGLWTVRNSDMPGTTAEQRAERIAKAKEYNTKLRTLLDAESPLPLMLQSYLSYVEGNFEEAGRLVDRFNTKTRGGDEDSQWLLHLIQVRLNRPGEALKALEACMRLNPRNIQPALVYAQIQAQLRNFDSAVALLDEILRTAPGFPAAVELRSNILQLKGEATSTDPVQAMLIEADRLTTQASGKADGDEQALALLKTGLTKFNNDARILRGVGMAYLKLGKKPEAAAAFEQALAADPNDQLTRKFLESAKTQSGTEGLLATIAANTELDEVTKAVQSISILRAAGRVKEAEALLAKATQLAPNDARVIELRFIFALNAKDLAAAQPLADLAAEKDLDGRKGLTYKARMLTAGGDTAAALAAVQAAMDLGNPGPELLRLMGRTQLAAGKDADAAKSFERAVEARPTEIESINELLMVLVKLDRKTDALTVARNSDKYAGDDSVFRHLYNSLEAAVGDRSLAISRRERISRVSPDDRRNLLSLAMLYMEDKRWAEAKTLIDTAKAIQLNADVVGLLANWHWAQGQKDEARKVFAEYEATLAGEGALNVTLAYGAFLIQNGDADDGIRVITEARGRQSPDKLQVDRMLAEVHYRRQNWAEAAKAVKSLIDASKQPVPEYQIRYAQCLLEAGSYPEAMQILNQLGKAGQEDLATLLLKAAAHGGLRETDAQHTLLDQAVARFPGEFMAFKRRGQFLLGQNPKTAELQRQVGRDAKEDFDAALRLQPSDAESLQFRALAHLKADPERGLTAAVQDMREAVRLDPNNDELFFGLVADLTRKNRINDAMAVSEEGVNRRPKDVGLLLGLGEIFTRVKAHPQAARFLRAAYEMDTKNAGVAQRFLDSLLGQTPPQVGEAEAVLQQLQSQVSANPGFLMAFAKIRIIQNRMADADKFAVDAVKLLDPKKPVLMLAWFNDIQRVQADKGKIVQFLDNITRIGVTPEAEEWLSFLKASLLIAEKANESKGIEILDGLMKNAKLPVVNQLAYRVLGSTYYGAGNHAEAAKIWEQSLAKYPDDYESLNNLAYAYLKFLNRKEDALKASAKAAEILKTSADVQDTYGLALFANGRAGESIPIFRNALLLAETELSAVTVSVHLAQALLESGDTEEAKSTLESANKIMRDAPDQITDDIKKELADLSKKAGL